MSARKTPHHVRASPNTINIIKKPTLENGINNYYRPVNANQNVINNNSPSNVKSKYSNTIDTTRFAANDQGTTAFN